MAIDALEKAEILARLERLQALLGELEHASSTVSERARVRERLKRELADMHDTIRTLGTHDPT